jgi:PAS domain S-box-containing protein
MKDLPEERLNHLAMHMPAVIYTCLPTENFPVTYISESSERILGYKASNFINTPSFWADHLHPEEKEEIFKNLANLFIENKHSHQYRFRLSNGEYKWFQDELQLVRNDANEPIEIFGCMLDVSQQRLIEFENRKLLIKENLIEQKIQFIEDLHDGLGAELVFAKILATQHKLDSAHFIKIIDNCILDLHLVVDTLAETDISLNEALINLKYRIEKNFFYPTTQIKFDIDLDLLEKGMSQQTILHILRILKESISNALNYAQASIILIKIIFNEELNQLTLTVKDNGLGFSLADKSLGRGTNNIKSRARKLGGDLNISSVHGTEITMVLPL